MDPLTTTPFGLRPVSAGLMQSHADTYDRPAPPTADKWAVFHQLCTARAHFGVSDRALSVLNALLSFHPDSALRADASLIVFPSNVTLGRRAHGMAESTLRRHLAALAEAGLILRHDSPNGKRYARRSRSGDVARAFGFDLRPLLVRAEEIAAAAEAAAREAETLRELREAAGLLRRDAVKLIDYAQARGTHGPWAALANRVDLIRKGLRRQLDAATLNALITDLEKLVARLKRILAPKPTETSGCDSQNERHHQSSNKESIDRRELEPPTPVTLQNVVEACPEIESYLGERPRTWREMIEIAHRLHAMIGIKRQVWDHAVKTMGAEQTAAVVACILQRLNDIRSPGAYLTTLCKKAAKGTFTARPMIMALLRARPS